MIRTRLIAGTTLLICSAACSPGPSATAASITGPTEIVVPLNFGTHMHGQDEAPNPRHTNATGQLNLKLSHDGQAIEYKLIASNIDNVVASHIHQAPVGVAGPIVVTLYTGAPGGGRHDGVLATGTITSSNLSGPLAGKSLSDLIDLIQSGNAYANVHTNDGVAPVDTGPGDYPSGEIRGQIRK